MSDLHARFERLARRGTPRGGDDVLAAALRSADGHGPLVGVDARAGDATDATGIAPVISIEPVNLEAVKLRRSRRRFGSVVAAGGVAASLFVGALAIGAFVGNGGGSNSPEGAVRQLAAAVSHEDPLAAADVLAPEEVRSLHGTVDLASKRAQELALAESASAPLAGLDFSVDNLNLTTESLGAGYAKVTVAGGTISAGTDNARFSPLMQKVLRNSSNNSAHADLATLGRGANLPTFVVTVQHDGNWYVSAAYTALEYIREANHLPAADFGSGVRATASLGADTPDGAVTDALQALARGDWPKLISLAPPDEIPVYDYRAALEQEAAATNTKPSFTIDKLGTTATVSGDTAKVVLKASGTTDSGTWSVSGSCFRFPLEYSSAETVTGDGAASVTKVVPESPDTTAGAETACGLSGFTPFLAPYSSPADSTSAAITVVKEDGRWFVSPVGTVLDLVDSAITSLTQRTLYTLIGVPELLPPDGTITLGKPVTVASAGLAASVYSFDGRAGERLLGLAKTTPATGESAYETEVQVFGPDGKSLEGSYGLLQGEALQLPADGKYTFVVQSFAGLSGSTVTIWDEADAPNAAKHPPTQEFPGEHCEFLVGGGESCTNVGGPAGGSVGPAPSAPTADTVPGSKSSTATSAPVQVQVP